METRAKNTCPVYGMANKLPLTQLPTVGDVMRLYSYIKHSVSKNTKATMVASEVASDIVSIWNKAGIPTKTERRVEKKVQFLHQSLRDVQKKKGKSKQSSISNMQQESNFLFDISVCQCINFDACTCSKEAKVPVLDRDFLKDQRSVRKMIISGVDKLTTSVLAKRHERAQKRQIYYEKHLI